MTFLASRIKFKFSSYSKEKIAEAIQALETALQLDLEHNLYLQTLFDLNDPLTSEKYMSQIPLPSDIRSWCLLKSPHVDKKSREHFSIKTYTRLFILGTTTVEFSTLSDRLNYLDFPSGVQVSSLWLRTGKVY